MNLNLQIDDDDNNMLKSVNIQRLKPILYGIFRFGELKN